MGILHCSGRTNTGVWRDATVAALGGALPSGARAGLGAQARGRVHAHAHGQPAGLRGGACRARRDSAPARPGGRGGRAFRARGLARRRPNAGPYGGCGRGSAQRRDRDPGRRGRLAYLGHAAAHDLRRGDRRGAVPDRIATEAAALGAVRRAVLRAGRRARPLPRPRSHGGGPVAPRRSHSPGRWRSASGGK